MVYHFHRCESLGNTPLRYMSHRSIAVKVKMTCFLKARNTSIYPIRTLKTKEEIMEIANIAISLEDGGNAGW